MCLAPAQCNLSCAKGVPDFKKCICITFDKCEDYNSVVDDFKAVTDTVAEAGQTTEEISGTTNEITKDIDDLTKYCRDNQDHLDHKYISDQISYIREKIVSLTLTVKSFTSNLTANSSCGGKVCTNGFLLRAKDCSCRCDIICGEGQIKNLGVCKCVEYAEGATIYELQDQISSLSKKIGLTVEDSEGVRKELETIYSFNREVDEFQKNMEHNFDELDLVQENTLIEELHKRFTTISDENAAHTAGLLGSCQPCTKHNSVLLDSCSCFHSPQTEIFYSIFKTFAMDEADIYGYKGKGDPTQLTEFITRDQEIRTLFEKLYEYFQSNSDSCNEQLVSEMIEEIKSKSTTLTTDFNSWSDAAAGHCTLDSCGSSQIKNLSHKACACVTIIDWDLLDDIEGEIDALENKIKGLNKIPISAKNTLLSNAELIKAGIPALRQYAVEFEKNLDVDYVQDRCTELNSWMSKLKIDVDYIQTNKTSKVCDATCPNKRWNYDPKKCECSCSVTHCEVPDHAIDYYNCLCVPVNSCTLTEDSCHADGGKILDYSGCACKTGV